MNITIEVTVAQVMWTDQHFILRNTTDEMDLMDDLLLFLDLMIHEVQVSNAGVYTCYAIINDTLGDSATIERHHTLTVESKSFFFYVK